MFKHPLLSLRAASLLLATGLGASPARAVTPLPPMDEGYYRPSQLDERKIPRPQDLERAVAASIQLYLEDKNGKNGGFCSASMVSRDGYVLTAGHCVELCLKEHGLTSGVDKGSLYSIHAYDQAKARGLSCPGISIARRSPLGIDKFVTGAQIVRVGRGFNGFDDFKAMAIPAADMQRMLGAQDDYAVLKFDLSAAKPPQEFTCIPVRDAPAQVVGEKTWSIGYPGDNVRANGFPSDGYSQYVSYGKVYASALTNQLYTENKDKFAPDLTARLDQFYRSGGQFITNMDTFNGNSGSMVIDQNGLIIGVLIAGAVPDKKTSKARFYDGSSVSMSFSRIREEIRQDLGAAAYAKIFSCK